MKETVCKWVFFCEFYYKMLQRIGNLFLEFVRILEKIIFGEIKLDEKKVLYYNNIKFIYDRL